MLLLLSCLTTPPLPPPEPKAPEVTPEQLPGLRQHMQDHLRHAARDGVLSGDVEDARADLAWLAMHPTEPGEPPTWGTWLNRMRESAAVGAQTQDLREQAMSVARMANACGGCHQSLGMTTWGPIPPEVPQESGHAQRYWWALDRLWEALLVGSNQPWEAALLVLEADPLPAADTLEKQAWASEVPTAARAALGDDNPDTRADLFGQILGACGSCHGAR